MAGFAGILSSLVIFASIIACCKDSMDKKQKQRIKAKVLESVAVYLNETNESVN